jgi:hypothetical protein
VGKLQSVVKSLGAAQPQRACHADLSRRSFSEDGSKRRRVIRGSKTIVASLAPKETPNVIR